MWKQYDIENIERKRENELPTIIKCSYVQTGLHMTLLIYTLNKLTGNLPSPFSKGRFFP